MKGPEADLFEESRRPTWMAQGETQGCDMRRGQKASQGQTMPSLVGRGWALNLTLSVVGLEKTYMF